MTAWWVILLLVGGVIAAVVYGHRSETQRLIKVRREFTCKRDAMADPDFVRAFDGSGINDDELLKMRWATADVCGVSEELISPEDTVDELMRLQHLEGDLLVWTFPLEVDDNALARDLRAIHEMSLREFFLYCQSNKKPRRKPGF